MWLIPTRDRPEALMRMAEACAATEIPRAAVMVDGGERQEEYRELDLPWEIHFASERLEMVACLNALYAKYPAEPFYGVIPDHTRPKTRDWATRVESETGPWNIVYTADNRLNGRHPETGRPRLTGAVALGGDLVRAMGWVYPDFMIHLYSDDVIEDIGIRLNNMKYLDDVIVEHPRMPSDDNYRRRFRGRNSAEADRRTYEEWKNDSGDWLRALRDVADGADLAGTGMRSGAGEVGKRPL